MKKPFHNFPLSTGSNKLKLVRKRLSMVGDEFTAAELKEKMDKHKVFGTYRDATIYQIIHKAKKLKLIEVKEQRPPSKGGKIYRKLKS